MVRPVLRLRTLMRLNAWPLPGLTNSFSTTVYGIAVEQDFHAAADLAGGIARHGRSRGARAGPARYGPLKRAAYDTGIRHPPRMPVRRIAHGTHARFPRGTARGRRASRCSQSPARDLPLEVRLVRADAIPLIVLSPARDPVEAINSMLRRAGHPVHCTWIPALRDLGDALTQLNPELLLHVARGTDELRRRAWRVRDQLAPAVPVAAWSPTASTRRASPQAHRARRARRGHARHEPAAAGGDAARAARVSPRARARRHAQIRARRAQPARHACCSARTTPSCRCRKASWSMPTRRGSSCSAFEERRGRPTGHGSVRGIHATRRCRARSPPVCRAAGTITR